MPQPITVPPMPIISVATVPPGSRPGIIALANKPTSVPKPTHTSTSLAADWTAWENSISGMEERAITELLQDEDSAVRIPPSALEKKFPFAQGREGGRPPCR